MKEIHVDGGKEKKRETYFLSPIHLFCLWQFQFSSTSKSTHWLGGEGRRQFDSFIMKTEPIKTSNFLCGSFGIPGEREKKKRKRETEREKFSCDKFCTSLAVSKILEPLVTGLSFLVPAQLYPRGAELFVTWLFILRRNCIFLPSTPAMNILISSVEVLLFNFGVRVIYFLSFFLSSETNVPNFRVEYFLKLPILSTLLQLTSTSLGLSVFLGRKQEASL